MQISDRGDRFGLPRGPLSTEARQASKGNIAIVAHRPEVDAMNKELAEEVEVIVAKTQPGGTRQAVTRLEP